MRRPLALIPPPKVRRHLLELGRELWDLDSKTLILVLLVSLFTGVLAGSSTVLLVPLLQAAGIEASGSAGDLSRHLSTVLGWFGLKPEVGLVLVLWLVVVIFQHVLMRWAILLHARFNIHLMVSQRKSFHDALAAARWEFVSVQKNWHLLHAATEDMYRVAGAAAGLIRVCTVLMMLSIYLCLSLYISWKITIFAFFTGLAMLIILRGNTRGSYLAGEEVTTTARTLFGGLGNYLEGFKLARCYGLESEYVAHFDRSVDILGDLRYKTAKFHVNGKIGFGIGNAFVIALVAYVILTFSKLSTASVLLLIYVFSRMMPHFSGLEQSIQGVASTLPGYKSFSTLRARCREASGTPTCADEPAQCLRELRLEGVCYRYSGSQKGVEELSASLGTGEILGVVGPSGAGKTTLSDLLVGLLQPQDGSIKIDGEELGPPRLASWRKQVSYVSQDAFFFNDTLRANLLWSQPNASEDEIWAALELAQCDELVLGIGSGLETLMGERGKRFSRGEIQRLSLARAILRKPTLLILDEATGSLDLESEHRFLKSLKQTGAERITVLITHRPSSLNLTDRVILMKDGRIKEQGTVPELMDVRGDFFRMVSPEAL